MSVINEKLSFVKIKSGKSEKPFLITPHSNIGIDFEWIL